MKKILLAVIFCISAIVVSAHDKDTDSLSIQSVIDACISMRDAAAAGDSASIRRSGDMLRNTGVTGFDKLRCSDDSIAQLKGHLVFTPDFADSLANDTAAYEKADDLTRSGAHRGMKSDGSYLTKTCMVKAGQSTKYTFVAKGYQELAVVAEAGGLVTMKIHVTNSAGLDQRYDDTKSVKKGMPQRKTSFNLPNDRRNTVALEVINCGPKDCSFVIISN